MNGLAKAFGSTFFFFGRSLHVLFGVGASCRFEPTCSRYAKEAFHIHGIFHGFRLVVARVFRCHPWGDYGIDPVPLKEDKWRPVHG